MRDVVIAVVSLAIFAGVYYGGSLQDRMRRKGGANTLSPMFVPRALATKEAFLFVCLLLVLAVFAIAAGLLDYIGYFDR